MISDSVGAIKWGSFRSTFRVCGRFPARLVDSRIQAARIVVQNRAMLGRAELRPIRGEFDGVGKPPVEVGVVGGVKDVLDTHGFHYIW
jgi:hypothetical protein